MRILVTRPSEDATRLAVRLAAMDVEAIAAPLLDIRNLAGAALDLSGIQAILFTSANGVRAFTARSNVRDLPALCVGDATAREAKDDGFVTVKSATGDVAALADLAKAACVPEGGALLHPAGSKVAGDLAGRLQAEGFSYRREVMYEAVKTDVLPIEAQQVLTAGEVDGVLFYSPRTGAAFAKLVRDANLQGALGTVTAYCLSDAVEDKIKDLAWASIKVAKTPDQESLLALIV